MTKSNIYTRNLAAQSWQGFFVFMRRQQCRQQVAIVSILAIIVTILLFEGYYVTKSAHSVTKHSSNTSMVTQTAFSMTNPHGKYSRVIESA